MKLVIQISLIKSSRRIRRARAMFFATMEVRREMRLRRWNETERADEIHAVDGIHVMWIGDMNLKVFAMLEKIEK